MHIHLCIVAAMKRSLFLILLMFSLPSLANTLQPDLMIEFNGDFSIGTSPVTDRISYQVSASGGAGLHGRIDPSNVTTGKQ